MSDRQSKRRAAADICPFCYNEGVLASGATCICQEMPVTVRPDDDSTMPPAHRSSAARPTVRFPRRQSSPVSAEELREDQQDADDTAISDARHYDRRPPTRL